MNLRWFNGMLQYDDGAGWLTVPVELDPNVPRPQMCCDCGAFVVDHMNHTCWVKAANENQ